MLCAEPMSRVLAAGFIITQLGSVAAMAEPGGSEPDVRERVFFDRSADPLAGQPDLRIVPLPEPRLPATALGEMMPMTTGRGVVTVLAALAPAKDAPMLDTGLPPWASPRALSWAPGPSVPRPLSEPAPALETNERRLAPDAQLPTLPKPPPMFGLARPHTLLGHADAQSLAVDRESWAMTRLPGAPRILSHEGDPLAALEFEEDRHGSPQIAAPAFIMPFANGRVTSLFNDGRRHPAIDLGGALGSPVLATTMRQMVTFAGWRGGYGKAVITRDPTGRTHLYGHLTSITTRVGNVLDQGEQLGRLGSTGHSTGPHVHYEVRDPSGRHINPMGLLFPGRVVRKGLAWGKPYRQSQPTTVASAQPRPR